MVATKIEWTVEIGLKDGGIQKIGCFSRGEAEEVKQYWFKNNREKIKFLHVVGGDTIGPVTSKPQKAIAKAMILKMFQ